MIRKTLEHLGLRGTRRKPVPMANTLPMLHVAEDVEGYLHTPADQVIDLRNIGLTPVKDGLYGFVAFLAHSGQHYMLGLQTAGHNSGGGDVDGR